jgi:hypothetical protein
MKQIDEVLNKYEQDLKKAEKGKCKKVSRCVDLRDKFRKDYLEKYKSKLEEVGEKLTHKDHAITIEEKSSEELFYGFILKVVPRHLRYSTGLVSRSSHWSQISFTANEHTLTIDVETIVRPNIELREHHDIEQIDPTKFNEDLLMEKVAFFLGKVFDATIILDFLR